MVLFVQGLIGTVKAIASEVCDNTNQVDSNKFSKSWTYFKARHAIFHTHFQTRTQFANPLSCPFSISQHTFQAVFFFYSSIWTECSYSFGGEKSNKFMCPHGFLENHTLLNSESIYTPFQPKTAQNPWVAHTYNAYSRVFPPSRDKVRHILEKHLFFIYAYFTKKKEKKDKRASGWEGRRLDLMCSGCREMSFNQGSISWMEKGKNIFYCNTVLT